MNTSLEILKAGRLSVLIQRHNLAIEHDRFAAGTPPLCERFRNLRKLTGLVVPEPRPQPHRVAGRSDVDDRPDAVIFGLVDEVCIGERRILERGQHWLEHGTILGIRVRVRVRDQG
jgi:hypothetical protein